MIFSAAFSLDFTPVAATLGYFIYALLLIVAIWGVYCCVSQWRRISQLQFRNETEQDEFLDDVEALLSQNQLSELDEICQNDIRALPHLALFALRHRQLSSSKLRSKLAERFQRDFLVELDYRTSWIQTIIKAAPMIGLFGTVIGMMGAFSKLSVAAEVSPDKLAADIMLALITTACGMAIAIPLVLATASLSIQIGKLEDFVASGLSRIVDMMDKKA
ncbi:MAG: MotA/TolQ/ExbB proton channel family protein [Thermoguttaceae bacterium]